MLWFIQALALGLVLLLLGGVAGRRDAAWKPLSVVFLLLGGSLTLLGLVVSGMAVLYAQTMQ
ncbi:hypothetical protein F8S09_10600 [Deinococcus sp. SDU3-2]|uniref:Uncharacterized protein n=1 Tax=Deinococcus terrestris TaxID=2651870 RepID=A0A7X1TS91_9DEIO|nr:hypothetical protein [Deinococcus terrestris]MPY67137.1 hypothetical protein [Deinococcus terrestris]